MSFQQMQYKGDDHEAKANFYNQEFENAKTIGYSDEQAHAHAKFMVEWYGHHFRKYS